VRLASIVLAVALSGTAGATTLPLICSPPCATPLPDCCASTCTDLEIDAKNCGACGVNCLAQGKVCEQGSCVVSCFPPLAREGDQCVLRCDPPCAGDEECHEIGGGTQCCAAAAGGDRWFVCAGSCCAPGTQCCHGSCCDQSFQCCGNGHCCIPGDVCLDEPNSEGGWCCHPQQMCEGTCCVGGRACAADKRCRPACNPACGRREVCCEAGTAPMNIPGGKRGEPPVRVRGGGGRCLPIDELCNGECCPESQRCGKDGADPSQRVCCPAIQWCAGVCCPIGEVCDGGKCMKPQADCEPPCGPDQSCCLNFECCECCADPDYRCGRFQMVPSPGGPLVRTCVPVAPPSGPPWLDPTACRPRTTTIFFQGIGGTCTGTLVACAKSFPVHCPYRGNAIAMSEPGPLMCCDLLAEGMRTKQPCDPTADIDCDGTPNAQDPQPGVSAGRAPGGFHRP
jgi:hypothetical protein